MHPLPDALLQQQRDELLLLLLRRTTLPHVVRRIRIRELLMFSSTGWQRDM